MGDSKSPLGYWVIVVGFSATIVGLLVGQTLAVFNYEAVVRIGLQKSVQDITEFGVQVNRAAGVADTIIYIPLLAISVAGLLQKKRWSLITSGAAMAISAYWPISYGSLLLFLPGIEGYQLQPGLADWTLMGGYLLFGVWGMGYLACRGEFLLAKNSV